MRVLLLLGLLIVLGVATWLIWERLAAQKASHTLITKYQEISFTQTPQDSTPATPTPAQKEPLSKPKEESLGLPSQLSLSFTFAESPNCEIVQHKYYALCYDEQNEQPRWTVHILEGEKLSKGRLRRTQDFRPDPMVKTGSANLEDYRHSGYDRGHLVPAGDFKWDSVGMSETFFLSNMSPQIHEFNAGIWEEVESIVRQWAKQKKRLVVYTGPILSNPIEYIGKSRIAVPGAFYKAVYWIEAEKSPRAVAFLVPHAPSKRRPLDFLVPVDSVEKLTGIDFFPRLPDSIEKEIERRVDKSFWQETRKKPHR
ncbi:MAG: DNA/RNA non-specific endonuclease [Bacteroidia bacterium]|nr:DNA/RNA non-specific endonuclease [Bacteroidia bacterium]MDW8133462.1 DNA/RNA non-specific endonuclease [Bacteroidia bacterium]